MFCIDPGPPTTGWDAAASDPVALGPACGPERQFAAAQQYSRFVKHCGHDWDVHHAPRMKLIWGGSCLWCTGLDTRAHAVDWLTKERAPCSRSAKRRLPAASSLTSSAVANSVRGRFPCNVEWLGFGKGVHVYRRCKTRAAYSN